jgi:hypothetical protein
MAEQILASQEVKRFQRFVINFKKCVTTQLAIYSSINFATLCGFWLSQPGHSKP